MYRLNSFLGVPDDDRCIFIPIFGECTHLEIRVFGEVEKGSAGREIMRGAISAKVGNERSISNSQSAAVEEKVRPLSNHLRRGHSLVAELPIHSRGDRSMSGRPTRHGILVTPAPT